MTKYCPECGAENEDVAVFCAKCGHDLKDVDQRMKSDKHAKNKTNFLVHINKLSKLVDTIENRDVSPLKDKSLYYAVQDIARLNLNKGNRR